jgi:TolB protein
MLLCSGAANALLKIEITEGIEEAEPIAVVPFAWRGQGEMPDDLVSEVIEADLHRSGYFKPLPYEDMLAKPSKPSEVRFQNWRMMDVPYLVIGEVFGNPEEGYVVEFRLFDVFRSKQMTGFRMPAVPASQLRMTSHQIADVVYEKITGEKGAFATRLAYVQKLPKAFKGARYRLYIADSDTENEVPVLASKSPIFSPAWSPDNNKLAYAVARSSGQSIYVFDLIKRKYERLTRSRDKFSAPSWSPDGKKMAMVKLANGSSDVYVMDLATKKLTQITRHWAIDTEPTWSPDSKMLVFTSDRSGGRAQLYSYRFDTDKVKRLTFEGKQNLRASFSPDGRVVTFVHLATDGSHNIGVYDFESQRIDVLTRPSQREVWHESPSFAPNGGMIIYSALWQKKTVLAVVSRDGRIHQRLSAPPTGVEVYEPAWSSFLN